MGNDSRGNMLMKYFIIILSLTFEGHEIKNIFYFENIKSIRFGFSFSPFRIVITEKNGENWIFDQVPKKNAREFVEKFDFINNYN